MSTPGSLDESDGFATWLAERAPPERPRPQAVQRARLSFLSALASENVVPRRSRRSFRALVLVAAAAAIVLVTFLPRAPRWSVRMDGPVRFGDRQYTPGEEQRLAVDLGDSGRLESLDATVDLDFGALLNVRLRPGGALAIPLVAELDGLSQLDFDLENGETYVHTAALYPGNPIRVHTVDGEAALHGTTVGVLVDELGTCLCVADGTARLEGPLVPGGSEAVGPRSTLRAYRDPGHPARVEPFPEPGSPGFEHTRDLEDYFRGF